MRSVLSIAMAYPGLPAPWLLEQSDTVLTTITELHEEMKG